MHRLGLILSIIGAAGLLFTALSFAADYQPMWTGAIKSLPEQDSYTHKEVATAVIHHIERTRAHFYLGVLFSTIQILGTVCLLRGRMPNKTLQPTPVGALVCILCLSSGVAELWR
jgi:hypothetical protein